MFDKMKFGSIISIGLLILASCGDSESIVGEGPTSTDSIALGESSLADVDGNLADAIERLGSCEDIPGAVVDLSLPGEYLLGLAKTLEWTVAYGPYDIGNVAGGDDALFDRQTVQLNVGQRLSAEQRVRPALSAAGQADSQEFVLTNFIARYWPSDGPLLVGLEGNEIRWAAALHDDGIAAVGYCLAPLSYRWNETVSELAFDDPLSALDLLLQDPDDTRVLQALGLQVEPAESTTLWSDRGPLERTYTNAPDGVIAKLDVASLVFYMPDQWLDEATEIGVCARTTEALHECVGIGSARVTSEGPVGWTHDVYFVPGQPVHLFLSGPGASGSDVDLVIVPAEMLAEASLSNQTPSDASKSVLVDLRQLYPGIETPAALAATQSATGLLLTVVDTPSTCNHPARGRRPLAG